MSERELAERDMALFEMRRTIAIARLDFLQQALPMAKIDEDFKLARSIAEAIGEISVEEGLAAFRRGLLVPVYSRRLRSRHEAD